MAKDLAQLTDDQLESITERTGRTMYQLHQPLAECEAALFKLRAYYDEVAKEHRATKLELMRRREEIKIIEVWRPDSERRGAPRRKEDIKRLVRSLSKEEIEDLLRDI